MIQGEPPFFCPLKHRFAVTVHLKYAVGSFNQLKGRVVAFQPTFEFGHQALLHGVDDGQFGGALLRFIQKVLRLVDALEGVLS